VVSWSEKVIVVPGATVTDAGEKFSDMSVPTPWGITIVVAPAGADVELPLLDVALLAVVAEEPVPEEDVLAETEEPEEEEVEPLLMVLFVLGGALEELAELVLLAVDGVVVELVVEPGTNR
jgi:hypothetical protein